MTASRQEFIVSVTKIERKIGLLRLAYVTYRRQAAIHGTCCQDREISLSLIYSEISTLFLLGVNTFSDSKLYTRVLIQRYREIRLSQQKHRKRKAS